VAAVEVAQDKLARTVLGLLPVRAATVVMESLQVLPALPSLVVVEAVLRVLLLRVRVALVAGVLVPLRPAETGLRTQARVEVLAVQPVATAAAAS
jgi:hypothetical protein